MIAWKQLTTDELLVLASLPKEPLAHSVPDLAEEVFGRADVVAISRVRTALEAVKEALFVSTENTRPYGHKERYGVKAAAWMQVQSIYAGIDVQELLDLLEEKT